MHRSARSFAAILCCLALCSGANAADHGITAKKLLLKSKPKMVLLSKDTAVVPGASGSASDPRCVPDGSGSGASVKLSDGINSVMLNMPCANWSANGAGTLYKYKDATGTPKVGKLKGGLLIVISPGMGTLPVPNGNATIIAQVTVGTDRYCMAFTGTGDGDKFLVKDTAAGSCPQICGNNQREGTEACDGTDANLCYTGQCYLCACIPPLTCGDNVIDAGEQCDGSSPGSCPAGCGVGCTCAPTSPCGDNFRAGSEQCDGTDASACPGQCHSDCTCPGCGNGITEGSEACDWGAPISPQCATGYCTTNCTCYAPVCGNGILEPLEECEGDDAPDCPGQCQSDCTCPPDPVCGNNVVESGEQCDPPSSECGVPGICDSSCQCDTSICGEAPSCGGACPSGGSCGNYGVCRCVAPTFCGSAPTCGGSCPAAYHCENAGPFGCLCVAG
jgi:hypothetical protein